MRFDCRARTRPAPFHRLHGAMRASTVTTILFALQAALLVASLDGSSIQTAAIPGHVSPPYVLSPRVRSDTSVFSGVGAGAGASTGPRMPESHVPKSKSTSGSAPPPSQPSQPRLDPQVAADMRAWYLSRRDVFANSMAARKSRGSTSTYVHVYDMPDVKTMCPLTGVMPGMKVAVRSSSPIPTDEALNTAIEVVRSETNSIKVLLSDVPPEIGNPFAVVAVYMVCHSYLRPIHLAAYESQGIVLPINPCRESCVWSSDLQLPFLYAIFGPVDWMYNLGYGIDADPLPENVPPINAVNGSCDAWRTDTPGPERPYFSSYNVSGFDVPCLSPDYNLTAEMIRNFGCGALSPSSDGNIGCSWPAPPPPITPEQYESLRDLGVSFGSVVLVMSLGAMVLVVGQPNRYLRYPSYMIFVALILAAIGAFSFMGTSFVGIVEMWGGGGVTWRFDDRLNVRLNPVTRTVERYNFDTSDYTTSSDVCKLQAFGIYVASMGIPACFMQLALSVVVVLMPKLFGPIQTWLSGMIKTIGAALKECPLLGRSRNYTRVVHWLTAERDPHVGNILNLFVGLVVAASVALTSSGVFVLAPGGAYCGFDPQRLDLVIPFWVVPLICLPVAALGAATVATFMLIRHWRESSVLTEKTRDLIASSGRLCLASAAVVLPCLACAAAAIQNAILEQETQPQTSGYINCELGIYGTKCSLPDDLYRSGVVVTSLLLFMMLIPSFVVYFAAAVQGVSWLVRRVRRRLGWLRDDDEREVKRTRKRGKSKGLPMTVTTGTLDDVTTDSDDDDEDNDYDDGDSPEGDIESSQGSRSHPAFADEGSHESRESFWGVIVNGPGSVVSYENPEGTSSSEE